MEPEQPKQIKYRGKNINTMQTDQGVILVSLEEKNRLVS